MSICLGCGLDLDSNGLLKAKLKGSGGLGCDTDGLFVNLAPTADGGNGLITGCGLTGSEGAIALDFGGQPTCSPTVRNVLTCKDGDGLHADIQSAITSNSGVCNYGATFLESGALPHELNGAGDQFFFHAPEFSVGPYCDDASQLWAGITLFDIAGLFVEADAGSLTSITFELYQSYSPGPITFGTLNPLFQVTVDNRFGSGKRRQDVILHDTTYQSVAGGQKLYFQLRGHVTQAQGTGRIGKFSEAQWEVTWLYVPVFSGGTGSTSSTIDSDFAGCQ